MLSTLGTKILLTTIAVICLYMTSLEFSHSVKD